MPPSTTPSLRGWIHKNHRGGVWSGDGRRRWAVVLGYHLQYYSAESEARPCLCGSCSLRDVRTLRYSEDPRAPAGSVDLVFGRRKVLVLLPPACAASAWLMHFASAVPAFAVAASVLLRGKRDEALVQCLRAAAPEVAAAGGSLLPGRLRSLSLAPARTTVRSRSKPRAHTISEGSGDANKAARTASMHGKVELRGKVVLTQHMSLTRDSPDRPGSQRTLEWLQDVLPHSARTTSAQAWAAAGFASGEGSTPSKTPKRMGRPSPRSGRSISYDSPSASRRSRAFASLATGLRGSRLFRGAGACDEGGGAGSSSVSLHSVGRLSSRGSFGPSLRSDVSRASAASDSSTLEWLRDVIPGASKRDSMRAPPPREVEEEDSTHGTSLAATPPRTPPTGASHA